MHTIPREPANCVETEKRQDFNQMRLVRKAEYQSDLKALKEIEIARKRGIKYIKKKRRKDKVNSNQDYNVKDDVKGRTQKKIQHTVVAGKSNMRVNRRIEGTPIERKKDTGANRIFVTK